MLSFIKGHAARLYAVVVAVLALVAHYVPDVPSEAVLAVAAAILGTGEAVHRVGNKAMADALASDPFNKV